MNIKRIVLFALVSVISVVLFGFPLGGSVSLLQPVFFIVFLYLIIKLFSAFSKTIFYAAILVFLIYAGLMLIPFPECSSSSSWLDVQQSCTCIGVEKSSFSSYDASQSQCVGYPFNYHCYTLVNGTKEEMSCDWLERARSDLSIHLCVIYQWIYLLIYSQQRNHPQPYIYLH